MNPIPENIPCNPPADAPAGFCEKLVGAVADLKARLQEHYERTLPGHAELVRNAIAEAEAAAWELSFFPQLFLPDLVEARIAELALHPALARSETAFVHAAMTGI